ncbi:MULTISPECIES: hypothetical protein [Kamptonema]|nr:MULTISPECIES: hypothetical protein [Kamptonema]CBN56717.1 hypothetical protein OSCI_3150021 [Kamptonema sp. PCC 6506]
MLETLKKVIDKYHTLGMVKADELLLRPTDALRLADELEQRGILILGVDIWYYSNPKSFVNFLLPPLSKGRVGVG